MRTTSSVMAVLGLVALAAATAAGDVTGVQNGSFDQGADGLDHWDVSVLADAGCGVVDVAMGAGDPHRHEMHVYAKNSWSWSGTEWQLDQTLETMVAVLQPDPVDEHLFPPAGMDALEFAGSDIAMGISPETPPEVADAALAQLAVDVWYNDAAGNSFIVFDASGTATVYPDGGSPIVYTNIDQPQTYVIPLPGLDASGMVTINIYAGAGLDPWALEDAGADTGETYTVELEGYLDEFHFTPEPATVALLVCGAGAMLRRRRVRR